MVLQSFLTTFRVRVRLVNWKQSRFNTKERIEQENLRLCKLEFRLCIQICPGEYQFVSPPSYSSIIEESKIQLKLNVKYATLLNDFKVMEMLVFIQLV